MTLTPQTAYPSRSRHYACLYLVKRALLLPQYEICSLEPILNLHTTGRPTHGVGWIFFEHDHWPVYSLDDRFNPQSELLATQRICAIINYQERYFGLICTHVITLPSAEIHLWPLPSIMARPGSPIQGLARYDNRMGLISTAADLVRFLQINQVYDEPSSKFKISNTRP